MSIPTNFTTEQLSLFNQMLVACDQTYNDPTVQSPYSRRKILEAYGDNGPIIDNGWGMVPDYIAYQASNSGWSFNSDLSKVDDEVGLEFDVYTKFNSTTGKTDYTIAFRGTRGLTPQDWFINLNYNKDKWFANPTSGPEDSPALRDKVESMVGYLLQNRLGIGTINLTGQSAGGSLAELAAYTLVNRQVVNPTQLTLTTFNGLGSIYALQDKFANFNPSLMEGMDTAHFYVNNDLVSSIGGGHLNSNLPSDTSTFDQISQLPRPKGRSLKELG